MNDFNNYIDQFFSLNNPLIYSIIFSGIIIVAILGIFFKVIFPMRMKFLKEKQAMILEQAKVMALFSELDPDPLLRVNLDGQVIQTNEASRQLFNDIAVKKIMIQDLLSGMKKDAVDYISNNLEYSFIENISNRTFTVNVKGDSSLKFANIYLHDITKIKEYETELEDYKDKLKTLAERLEQKFETEKKSISSELHDDIGQRLVLLKLKFQQIDNNGGDLYADLDGIYSRVRELSHLLKPAEIDELGLRFAIQNLVNKITSDSPLNGSFSFLGEECRLEPAAELCFIRTAQEALSNIIKHSHASEFSIQLIFNDKDVCLIISDDGRGIPAEYFQSKDLRNFGIGLFNMKERVENLKGSFKINSFPDEGTSIIIQLPKLVAEYESNTVVNS
jgi:signal transduction histidine kinase